MPVPFVALVSADEAFDPITHARNDLDALSLSIEEEEGEYARADIEIANPRAALIDRRLLISEEGVLLFDGTITAAPRGALGEVVNIEAIARPVDAEARIEAEMTPLKVRPYVDELFIPEGSENDSAEILTGWGRVLSWDRATHEVRAVDVLGEGAPLIEVGEALKDTLYVDISDDVPAMARLTVSVEWNEVSNALHALGSRIFPLDTMTPAGLVSGWPKAGDEISPGFFVERAEIYEKSGFLGRSGRETVSTDRNTESDELDPAFVAEGQYADTAELVPLEGSLNVRCRREIRRREFVSISLAAGVQDILNTGAVDEEEIALRDFVEQPQAPGWRKHAEYAQGDRVIYNGREYEARADFAEGLNFSTSAWLEIGAANYITSRQVASFIQTERGHEAAEHIVKRLTARLRYLSRAVRVSFSCVMPDPATVSCGARISVASPSFIGGAAEGKIVSYSLSWQDGARTADFTIACAAGLGGPDTASLTVDATPPEYAVSGVSVEIAGRGSEQEAAFKQSGDIPETIITLTPIAPAAKDYERSLSMTANGTISIPKQIELT